MASKVVCHICGYGIRPGRRHDLLWWWPNGQQAHHECVGEQDPLRRWVDTRGVTHLFAREKGRVMQHPLQSETAFGGLISRLRQGSAVPLRRFCREHGFDAGNYSKMERGLRPAPRNEATRQRIAQALGLPPGSDQWRSFMDLADLSVGEVPKDLLLDREVMAKMPMMFRTLRGEKMTRQQADDLAALIREKEKPEPLAEDATG